MRDHLLDARLSYTAIGIYAVMLNDPATRACSEAEILRGDHISEEHEIMSGIDLLSGCGYIERVEGRWVVKGA